MHIQEQIQEFTRGSFKWYYRASMLTEKKLKVENLAEIMAASTERLPLRETNVKVQLSCML